MIKTMQPAPSPQIRNLPIGWMILISGLVLGVLAVGLCLRKQTVALTHAENRLFPAWEEVVSRYAAQPNWGSLRRDATLLAENPEVAAVEVTSPDGFSLFQLQDPTISPRAHHFERAVLVNEQPYTISLVAPLPTIPQGWTTWVAGVLMMTASLFVYAIWMQHGHASAYGINHLLHGHPPLKPLALTNEGRRALSMLDIFLKGLAEKLHQGTENRQIAEQNAERLQLQLRDSQASEVMARQRSSRLQAVFDQSAEAMGFLSAEGAIIELNPIAQELAGRPLQELRGRAIWELDSIAPPEQIRDWVRQARSGEIVLQQVDIKPQGKPLQVIDLSIKPLLNATSGVEMLIFEAHNITERIRAEQALHETVSQFQQSQKMEAIGRLAGGIAHDFNNLLTSILGFSNMVLDQVDELPEAKEDLNEVIQAAKRAQNLTQKLLAMSRKDIPASSSFDLNKLILDLGHLIRITMHEDIDYVTDLATYPCVVQADTTSLEQVLVNLAVNARDAMPRSGRLYISTEKCSMGELYCKKFNARPGSYIRLSVKDTGCGMDTDVLEHAFEPFFTTKESGQGTGLGLSTVYAIVQQYEGMIDIHSEPGVGTEFNIYFPTGELQDDGQSTQKAAPPQSLTGGDETILLVEDEDGVRRMASRMIESLGYNLLQAADGEQGATLAEGYDGTIDLIVTDVVMPQLSGPEMIDRLRVSIGHIPHLYVSGFTQDKLKQHGADGSEDLLIKKPYTRETLGKRIRAELDQQKTTSS